MNPNKALWEKGDFTRIAASMRESGEALVAGLGVTAGMKVLDLGCCTFRFDQSPARNPGRRAVTTRGKARTSSA